MANNPITHNPITHNPITQLTHRLIDALSSGGYYRLNDVVKQVVEEIRQEEREACAQIADHLKSNVFEALGDGLIDPETEHNYAGRVLAYKLMGEKIRARGESNGQ